jgi:Transglycosylase SLT domain
LTARTPDDYINMGPSLESFHYSRVSAEWGVLRLLANLGTESRGPVGAHVIVQPEPDGRDLFYAHARLPALERRLLTHGRRRTSQLLWRAAFALPLDVIEVPDALFSVVAFDGFFLELPAPGLQLTLSELAARARLSIRTPQERVPTTIRTRQRVVALATAVAVTAGSTPAVAMAASGGAGGSLGSTTPGSAPASSTPVAAIHPATVAGKAATRGASMTAASAHHALPHPFKLTHLFSDKSHPAQAASTRTHITAACSPTVHAPVAYAAANVAGRIVHCPVPAGHPAGTAHPATAEKGSSPKGATLSVGVAPKTGSKPAAPTSTTPTTPAPTSTPTTPGADQPTPGKPTAQPTSNKPAPVHAKKITHPHHSHHGGHTHATGGVAVSPPAAQPGTGTSTSPVSTLSPTPPGTPVPQGWTGTVSADPALTGAVTNLSGLLSNGNRPPSFLIPIYMEAGHKYGVPWEVLAAINAIETDYGQNLNTSSAGAVGWMQFEPSTWAKYGVAVDGHSVPNPYDPRDAIFAAAKYLAAAGAREDVAKAVYAYNHATWYVSEVMARARAIAGHAQYQRLSASHGKFSIDFTTAQKRGYVVRYSSGVLSHFDRLIAAANMVSAANFPYVWGGGHEQPSVFAPFDCSGSVSYVMQQAGYSVPSTVSGNIPSWKLPAGPGKATIFYNSWHTFMRIGNRYFGTSGFARPGGGAGWFNVNKLPAGYLAKFRTVHVPGLGVNSFAPGEVYTPIALPKPKPRHRSSTLDVPVSMRLSTLGSFPAA